MSSSDKPIKFELKRLTEVNKDTIAVELRRVALLSQSSQLSIADFGKLGGRVGANTIRRHFRTWNAALEYAGLEHMFSGVQKTKQGISHRNQKCSDEELSKFFVPLLINLEKLNEPWTKQNNILKSDLTRCKSGLDRGRMR